MSIANANAASEPDYITFLEAQLEKSDGERMMVVGQIEGLAAHFGQLTALRSELADRTHQLAIAQQQLSQEALLVQEEREKVARLMNENAVLSAQTDDDRAKIASLIGLRRAEMGVTSGPAGLHPSLLAAAAGAHAAGAEGYYGAHLHTPSFSAYQDKLLAQQKANAPPERCIPAAHAPIRVQLGGGQQKGGPSSFSPAAGGPHKAGATMSLRAVVTDYANTHPHAFATALPPHHGLGACSGAHTQGPSAAAAKTAAKGAGNAASIAPTAVGSSPPQPTPAPNGFVLSTDPNGAFPFLAPGVVDGRIADALQPPVGSQLVATLAAEVETLKTLLDEQRRAYEAERARRLHDERRRSDLMAEKDRAQVAALDALQAEAQTAVRALCLYRHQQQIVERALRGEIELLKVSCVETQRSMTHMARRKTQDMALALELAATQSSDQTAKLRADLAERRAAHFSEKEALLAAVVKLREENDKLIAEVAHEKKARARAESRLRLAKEGAQSEVGLLKSHLRAIEKKVYFAQVKGAARPDEHSSAQLIASAMAQQAAAQHTARAAAYPNADVHMRQGIGRGASGSYDRASPMRPIDAIVSPLMETAADGGSPVSAHLDNTAEGVQQ